MTRRDLLQKVLIGGASLMVVPQILESCTKSDSGSTNPLPNGNSLSIDLTDPSYSALNTAGGYVVVSGIIVANTGSNVFVALNANCTHQGCTIAYSKADNDFPCPCHGSVFSTSGSVLNGPATIALKSHTVSKSGNTLTVSL